MSVDGKQAWLPEASVDALAARPSRTSCGCSARSTRIMQARDRALIVPDKSVHKALWPVLGRPGVLLVEGEVAGTWRTKAGGRKLTITVEPFGPQPQSVWAEIDAEAERVAAVRAASSVAVERVE